MSFLHTLFINGFGLFIWQMFKFFYFLIAIIEGFDDCIVRRRIISIENQIN